MIKSYRHAVQASHARGAVNDDEHNYYVCVVDSISNDGMNDRVGLLAGPFPTNEAAAAMVDAARELSHKVNTRAVWYGYGVAAVAKTYAIPGTLNELLGIDSKLKSEGATI